MKGDFSRDTFDPRKKYVGVLMQQGRVQTDADWNEQWAINEHREEITDIDVIGACGAPIHDAGFEITTDGKTLLIGKGRMYVDGIPVENDADGVDYAAQPYLLDAPKLEDVFKGGKLTQGIAYLDVWLRHITALDDALIREKALGGPDTTTRAQVVWQVKVLPVETTGDPNSPECARLEKIRARLEINLKKLVDAGGDPAEIAKLQTEIDEVNKKIAAECGGELTCDRAVKEWDALAAARGVTLNARTQPPQDTDDPCLIPPSAGYQRLENQLYRVEVHQGGTLQAGGAGGVTFKWSRDNGTVVTGIEKISGLEVTVRDVGPDTELGFANGQWIEVIDDAADLNGQPGELIQIETVNAGTRVIKLKSAPSLAVVAGRHPKLRRWDSAGAVAAKDAWQELEGGIEVNFSTGEYRTGDYWLIPARTATGEIEWPPFEVPNVAPEAQPPRGIQHHYCRLALVSLSGEKLGVNGDCRLLFPPLTEVGAQAAAQALHVTATNWENDDVFAVANFLKEGLRVTLDGAPDPLSAQDATVIVTLELGLGGNDLAGGSATPIHTVVVLDGAVTVEDGNVIRWQAQQNLQQALSQIFDRLGKNSLRVRVTLKGHTIWSAQSEPRIYLDGQAFGLPDRTTGRARARIALKFASGDHARASDFESWFYLGQAPVAVKPLQITNIVFRNPNLQPAGGGDISLPPIPDNVNIKAGEQINIIDVTFNRAVQSQTLDKEGSPQAMHVERALRGKFTPLRGNIQLIDPTTARFMLIEPPTFIKANYRIRIGGTDGAETPAVHAQDDGSLLDGDFSGEAGGDFVMPFAAQ